MLLDFIVSLLYTFMAAFIYILLYRRIPWSLNLIRYVIFLMICLLLFDTVLTYRHELGMNYNFISPDLIVGSCLQVVLISKVKMKK